MLLPDTSAARAGSGTLAQLRCSIAKSQIYALICWSQSLQQTSFRYRLLMACQAEARCNGEVAIAFLSR